MSERLLVDMDGVLADCMGRAFTYVGLFSGYELSHEDVREYWFEGMPHKPLLLEALKRRGFYRSLEPITGAVRAVNRLRREFDVVVCTAPMPGVETCESEKRDWLQHYFDRDFARQAIVTPNKAEVEGKAIIEDNPYIDVPYQPIMFDQPWNRNVDHPRMYGWGDLDVVRGVMNDGR